jgi:copper transport protein
VRLGRAAVAVALAGVGAIAGAGVAAAHATLTSASPTPDSVLEESPDAIVLTFSEPVETVDRSIRLVDDTGAEVETGPINQDRGTDTIAVEVDGPLDGSYVVSWRALSIDSHPIGGAYTFAVGLRTDLDPNLLDDITAAGGASSSAELSLGIGRALSYAGAALLVGGFFVLWWCDRALLDTRRAQRTLIAAALLGAVGTAMMIVAQASLVGAGAASIGSWIDVIQSRSGRWWLARLASFVIAVPVLIAARGRLATRPALYGGIAMSALVLAFIAAGGHGLSGRVPVLAYVATVMHLAAMSVWAGGLAMLAIAARAQLRVVFGRFSPLALGSVIVLALTGAFNGWRQIGGLDQLTASSYGRWLIVKLAIVAVVIVVAVINRRLVRRDTDRPLRGGVAVELAGMVAIVAATAGLVTSPPPYAAAGGTAVPVSVTAANGDARARIDLFPAAAGGTTLTVGLYSTGAPLDPADEITVTASLPAEQLGPIDIATRQLAPNAATTDDAVFPLPGVWEITVTARYGEFDQVVFTQSVEIRSR